MEEKRKRSTGAKKNAGSAKRRVRRPDGFVGDLDQYLFGQGTHYDIFRKLGAHPM